MFQQTLLLILFLEKDNTAFKFDKEFIQMLSDLHPSFIKLLVQ